MRFSFISDQNLLSISRELSILTNHDRIDVNNIKYDQDKNYLLIPLKRRCLREYRYGAFGRIITKYSDHFILSQLEFHQIKECRILKQSFVESCNPIMLLFGIQLEQNRLYFCSAEEYHGLLAFELEAQFNRIEFEFNDNNALDA